MPEILRYTRGDELESLELTWPKNDGTLWNFSTGWTFRARIGTGSGFFVEKTSGFTGAATAPNLSINFTAGELDGVGAGTYHLDVQATLTATTQTITRTWMFQVLAGVGTDTLPQSPTSLAVLGDLTVGGDLTVITEDKTIVGAGTLIAVGVGRTVTVTGGGLLQSFAYGPTIVYDDPFFLSGGRTFDDSSILKNPAGIAKTMPHHTGYYANATTRGDGALFTTTRSAFLDSGGYDAINSGTVTASEHASFDSAMAVGSGATATLRRAFKVQDATGTGTVTTQVGVEISTLTKAGTNIGIRNASTEVATPSVATITAAGNTITANAKVKRLNNTSGGTITLTSTPTIADGQDGQLLTLFNSSVNNVTLTHGAANNLRLDGGTNKTLAQRASICLMFSSDLGDWIQISPMVSPT